jgi:hypothetical protein
VGLVSCVQPPAASQGSSSSGRQPPAAPWAAPKKLMEVRHIYRNPQNKVVTCFCFSFYVFFSFSWAFRWAFRNKGSSKT